MAYDIIKDCEIFQFELDRLWKYFEFHAKQRTEIFRFFVILSSIIFSGSITLLAGAEFKDLDNCSVGTQSIIIKIYLIASIFLGFMLMTLSWIFWMLDSRNFTMIDESRKAIIAIEDSKYIQGKIFTVVRDITESTKPYTFSYCYNLMFIIVGSLGCIVFAYSISLFMLP